MCRTSSSERPPLDPPAPYVTEMKRGPSAASSRIVSCSAGSDASERGGYSSNENGTAPAGVVASSAIGCSQVGGTVGGRTAADRARLSGHGMFAGGCRARLSLQSGARRAPDDDSTTICEARRIRVDQCDALFRRSVGPWSAFSRTGRGVPRSLHPRSLRPPHGSKEPASSATNCGGARGFPKRAGAPRSSGAPGTARSRRCSRRPGTRARACTSTAAARGRPPPTARSTSSRRPTSACGSSPSAASPGRSLRLPRGPPTAASPGRPGGCWPSVSTTPRHPTCAARSSRSAPIGCGSSSS